MEISKIILYDPQGKVIGSLNMDAIPDWLKPSRFGAPHWTENKAVTPTELRMYLSGQTISQELAKKIAQYMVDYAKTIVMIGELLDPGHARRHKKLFQKVNEMLAEVRDAVDVDRIHQELLPYTLDPL